MDILSLKTKVLEMNLGAVSSGLVTLTFGNASAIDREQNALVIKPSGIPYEKMTVDQMVVTDLQGNPVLSNSATCKPSSDLATHVELYAAFPNTGAVIHTHSTYATIFAQLHRSIPPLGTTHADYFHGPVPVTRPLTDEEITGDYVTETGKVIIETFANISPDDMPAVLVSGHGPFVWGATPDDALMNAQMLEEAAKLAWHVQMMNPDISAISQSLLDRHFYRKHGQSATYGQVDKEELS